MTGGVDRCQLGGTLVHQGAVRPLEHQSRQGIRLGLCIQGAGVMQDIKFVLQLDATARRCVNGKPSSPTTSYHLGPGLAIRWSGANQGFMFCPMSSPGVIQHSDWGDICRWQHVQWQGHCLPAREH